jgi:hypothetical protein
MGRMFKQLGVLQSDEVVCCSPADFSTGYAGGQAAIKTKGMLEKALGKTLFIDEAYGKSTYKATLNAFASSVCTTYLEAASTAALNTATVTTKISSASMLQLMYALQSQLVP